MKLILENWRSYLNEAVDHRIQRQLDALLDHPDLGITVKGVGRHIQFEYAEKFRLAGAAASSWTTVPGGLDDDVGPLPWGEVTIHAAAQAPAQSYQRKGEGNCYNGFIISWTEVRQGWGPLLYEVALEWASQYSKKGLAADRSSVSEDALVVWDKYAARSDVKQNQLDVAHPDTWTPSLVQLTPEPEDDCNQTAAVELGGKEGWDATSISKMYYKPNGEVIAALKGAGRFAPQKSNTQRGAATMTRAMGQSQQ